MQSLPHFRQHTIRLLAAWLILLAGAFGLTAVWGGSAFADETAQTTATDQDTQAAATDESKSFSDGGTHTVEGNVTTSESGTDQYNHDAALTVTSDTTVTVNGNVTSNGVNYSDGVKTTDSTVTVNGDVTTTGIVSNAVSADNSTVNVTGNVELGDISGSRKDSSAVIANDSIVTIDGNVIVAKGDDHSDGIIANDNSTVSVTDVTINSYHSTGISAGDSNVTARNVTVTNDDTTGVNAYGNSNVEVDTINTNGEGTVGMDIWFPSTGTANSVTVSGKDSIGVIARFNNDGDPGLVTVNGNVTASGEGSSAVNLYITNGTVHVAGNATAEHGYGTIIYLASKNRDDYKGAPTLVVDGTLSGTKAPIAIVLDQEYENGTFARTSTRTNSTTHALTTTRNNQEYAVNSTLRPIYDLDAYDLPNIIVQSLESGESWVKVLYGGWYEDPDGWEYYELREDTSAAARLVADAVLKNVDYIVSATNLSVTGARTVTVNGASYLVAKEGTELVLKAQVGSGQTATYNWGAYSGMVVDNGDGTFTLVVQRGGNLVFSATGKAVPSNNNEGGDEPTVNPGTNSNNGGGSSTIKTAGYTPNNNIVSTANESGSAAIANASDNMPATGDSENAALMLLALMLVMGGALGMFVARRNFRN